QSLAAQYVSRDVVGYQDLDGYGQWVSEPAYGMVWVPVVAAGWAPYHYGYWNWIGPWGWTWIANEPWGFAPCHYGRWVHARHGWAWLPGPRGGPRPVYAPALVAWRGERYTRTNPDIKHRPKVGWIPLGNNEVYDPPFHASANYLRAANLSNTHLGRVDLDRYVNERQRGAARGADRRYANDNVKGAYADAPREAFTSVQSIGPPRGRVEPNISLRARFAPHEVPHAAPVDRPVAHPVGYAPEASSDRPHPRASTRIDVESPRQPDRPPSQAQGAVGRAVQSPYVAPLPGSRQMHPIVSESQTRQPVVREAEPQHPVVREAQPQQPAVRMSQPQQPVARVAEPRQAVVRESEPRQYSPAPVRSAPPPAAPAAVGHDSHPQVSRQERQP
ncbi:MAG TPA: DUF6600 domain-containing protein, partial [Steroidobacteraceae bacterium]|nr:DUF6600 domain-containing protein [Steroidobacteraceae bacterium]